MQITVENLKCGQSKRRDDMYWVLLRSGDPGLFANCFDAGIMRYQGQKVVLTVQERQQGERTFYNVTGFRGHDEADAIADMVQPSPASPGSAPAQNAAASSKDDHILIQSSAKLAAACDTEEDCDRLIRFAWRIFDGLKTRPADRGPAPSQHVQPINSNHPNVQHVEALQQLQEQQNQQADQTRTDAMTDPNHGFEDDIPF